MKMNSKIKAVAEALRELDNKDKYVSFKGDISGYSEFCSQSERDMMRNENDDFFNVYYSNERKQFVKQTFVDDDETTLEFLASDDSLPDEYLENCAGRCDVEIIESLEDLFINSIKELKYSNNSDEIETIETLIELANVYQITDIVHLIYIDDED